MWILTWVLITPGILIQSADRTIYNTKRDCEIAGQFLETLPDIQSWHCADLGKPAGAN